MISLHKKHCWSEDKKSTMDSLFLNEVLHSKKSSHLTKFLDAKVKWHHFVPSGVLLSLNSTTYKCENLWIMSNCIFSYFHCDPFLLRLAMKPACVQLNNKLSPLNYWQWNMYVHYIIYQDKWIGWLVNDMILWAEEKSCPFIAWLLEAMSPLSH